MAGRGNVRERGLLRSSLYNVCRGNEFRVGTTTGETMEGMILFKCVAGAKFPNVEAEGFALELFCRWGVGVDVVYSSSYRVKAICASAALRKRAVQQNHGPAPFPPPLPTAQLQLQAFTVA